MRAFACLTFCAAVACAAALCACDFILGDDEPALDPKLVAEEADNGNLKPMTALVTACRSEVEKYGRRREICKKLDVARSMRKPWSIRF